MSEISISSTNLRKQQAMSNAVCES
jgi:hypothetical protein